MACPLALIVLDGWGHAGPSEHNAIHQARTPVWDRLWRRSPRALLRCSGPSVGLPEGQMGNSEVGHLCLGAGRVVPQSLVRIDQAIEDGSFFSSPALGEALSRLPPGATLHILGMVSDGGVHSHERHVLAALRAAARRGVPRVAVHAFLDGRDTPPRGALRSLRALDAACRRAGSARVASVTGRYYAMDRDARWERTERAFALLAGGRADRSAGSAEAALRAAYAAGESDEFASPTRVGEAAPVRDGDAVLFMNFRADRARQLARAFAAPGRAGFAARPPRLSAFVTLTDYGGGLDVPCMFAPRTARNGLGERVSAGGLAQLRLAETEKYAHVTSFFSGGREAPFPGESRELVPSPRVAGYAEAPEMGAAGVTDALVAAVRRRGHGLIVCNYANGDMVGHTGEMGAAVAAVEAVDRCLGRVAEALRDSGGRGAGHRRPRQLRAHARPGPGAGAHGPHPEPGAAGLRRPPAGPHAAGRRPGRRGAQRAALDGAGGAGGDDRPAAAVTEHRTGAIATHAGPPRPHGRLCPVNTPCAWRVLPPPWTGRGLACNASDAARTGGPSRPSTNAARGRHLGGQLIAGSPGAATWRCPA